VKRIRWTRKKIASLAMVVALFAIAAASTLAYYTDAVEAHNIITSGGVDITLNDMTVENGVAVDFPEGGISGVMPTATVSKVVSVTNESAEAWVRIRLEERIEARDGSALPAELTDGTPVYTLNLVDNTPWIKGSDDNWYYEYPLWQYETSEVLFDSVTFSPALGNEYQGCTVYIDVIAEAVQCANNPLPDSGRYEDIPGWPEESDDPQGAM